MKAKVLNTVCLLMATGASAETQLERFEGIAEEMNTAMLQMMINEIESQGGDGAALRELDGMFPPWTDEIRAAAGCIIDSYVEEVGSDEVNAMMDRMDEVLPQMATMTVTESEESGSLDDMSPAGMSLDRTLEINDSCGMMDLQIAASQESGFFEAMMEAGATVPGNN